MKVLAVIPARAGSKGIPNKNIRIINGKPLIWYAINNAIQSEYITDIIVSTDSKEVEHIARKMGVAVRVRDKKLCGDEVTLDAVVYDACSECDCDYVVTMQPTSPTLTVNTLDNAIKYCMDKQLDTVISVINQPHLSWREEEGKKLPNYKERLNRQYLPKHYNETGAFVVSKRQIVTNETRIGQKIDVFEISENEAVDIDTFGDFIYAEQILKERKIAVYVNGNVSRGSGHIYRALELADEFYMKPDIYYDINQTRREDFGMTTHTLIGVDGIGELLQCLKKEKYNILINDILSTSIDYMIAVKRAIPDAGIINFEDDGEGACLADAAINALYGKKKNANDYVGEDYYIAPKSFMIYEPISIKEKVENVVVTFGGADPQNYTERILKMISAPEYKAYHFTVVLGRINPKVEELMKYNEYANIEVVHDVKNMPELMEKCDIGVTSRGRTCYELAMLGIPTIAMAQNEREERHGFACRENGFLYLGKNPGDKEIKMELELLLSMDQKERQELQNCMLAHDLKNGRKRVMELINNL